jgi:hypothetical protein
MKILQVESMKKLVFLFVIVILFNSCSKPCGEASTGPPSFMIEIIDAITNENVFTNGTFTQNQLSVTTANSTSQGYFFNSENNVNLISINPARTDGTFTTLIKLNNQITIPIESTIEKSRTKCFESYFITSVTVSGYSYVRDSETGIIKIKI